MNRIHRLRLFLLPIFLALAACAGKDMPGGEVSLAPLLEDPVFMENIRASGTLGARGITIVAPSSGFSEKGGERFRAIAAALGVTFPKTALNRKAVPYHANSDDARLQHLAAALADPGTEVIWAALGGYGSGRLLADLAKLPAPSKKIIIGYSDITFLHLYFQKLGWRTVHAPLFGEIASSRKDTDTFRRLAELLAGRIDDLRYEGFIPRNAAARRMQNPVRGAVTGGNLTCVTAAVGTPWALDAAGKIVFLEDVKEPGYKIDRMLTQLDNAGHFRGVKAIIFGTFTAGDENTAYALERFARTCSVPVFSSDLFGHGPKNYPLIFNAPAVLEKTGGTYVLSIRADSLP